MNTTTLKRSLAVLATTALGAGLAASAAPKPAVSSAQAETAATAKIPGKALSAKYEFEDGHWQYAVLVKDKKGQLNEVEVSAATGKVTATEKTSAAEEAKETAADKKAAMKAKNSGASHAMTPKGESKDKGEAGEAKDAGG